MEYDTLHDHCALDDRLWENLRNSDPDVISHNCSISFDSKERFYKIPVLNEEFAVYSWEEKIAKLPELDINKGNEVELDLFLLHYLLGAKDMPLTDKGVSEKELKGGEMFFRGPHALPVENIIKKYSRDPKGFIKAGTDLGATVGDFGDASIKLMAAPKIPITYVLWIEDDEFPASVTILFDPTIQEFLPLDVIYGVCIYTYQKLVK